MTSLIILCFYALTVLFSPAHLRGAWQLKEGGDPGETATLIATRNYLTVAVYNELNGAFIRTYGGDYRLISGKCLIQLEFDSKDISDIGQEISFSSTVGKTSLTLENRVKTKWFKLDDAPSSAALAGCWRITARELFAMSGHRDGILSPTSRKTLKIISGTRFQWVDISPATYQFLGTRGGKYTLVDGKYTEHFAFFSRDPSRVGSELSFNAEVKRNKWIHTGKSSTGDAVHELWEKQ